MSLSISFSASTFDVLDCNYKYKSRAVLTASIKMRLRILYQYFPALLYNMITAYSNPIQMYESNLGLKLKHERVYTQAVYQVNQIW